MEKKIKILLTGGYGFIGSALVRLLSQSKKNYILNIDKLTYAANLDSLKSLSNSERYKHIKADISNYDEIEGILNEFQPDKIFHLAAETHVDRSIDKPFDFIQSNIIGTYNMLEISRSFLAKQKKNDQFRFIHVSTDEVFGSLGKDGMFTESSPYDPSSPYSASKAASDHLARSWYRTFGLPTIITNCSNNYGPFQYPEKLIPLIISNAIKHKSLPIYGDGKNIRDWLYVDDHAEALALISEKGKVGQTYNIGGNSEKNNISLVKIICEILDEVSPSKKIESYKELIKFVDDRPGHDKRYAMDISKIKSELGWTPNETFKTGIKKTVKWYLENLLD